MFILSSISSGLEFWSVNDTSIYKNSKLNVFKNIKLLNEAHLHQIFIASGVQCLS